MDLLSFGMKNMGAIQSLINGFGVVKQFLGNNTNFTNPYMNPKSYRQNFNHYRYPNMNHNYYDFNKYRIGFTYQEFDNINNYIKQFF